MVDYNKPYADENVYIRNSSKDLVWDSNTHDFVVYNPPEHLYALSTAQTPSFPEIPTTVYMDASTISSNRTLYDENGIELHLYNEEEGFYWDIEITPNEDPSKCTITYINPGAQNDN